MHSLSFYNLTRHTVEFIKDKFSSSSNEIEQTTHNVAKIVFPLVMIGGVIAYQWHKRKIHLKIEEREIDARILCEKIQVGQLIYEGTFQTIRNERHLHGRGSISLPQDKLFYEGEFDYGTLIDGNLHRNNQLVLSLKGQFIIDEQGRISGRGILYFKNNSDIKEISGSFSSDQLNNSNTTILFF